MWCCVSCAASCSEQCVRSGERAVGGGGDDGAARSSRRGGTWSGARLSSSRLPRKTFRPAEPAGSADFGLKGTTEERSKENDGTPDYP